MALNIKIRQEIKASEAKLRFFKLTQRMISASDILINSPHKGLDIFADN